VTLKSLLPGVPIKMLGRGDYEGQRVWMRISGAIAELQ
jgi:hypothetical protein